MPTIAEAMRAMQLISKKLASLPPVKQMTDSYALTAPHPVYPAAPNAFLRTTMPNSLTLQPDNTRQFFNPAIPQIRNLPLTSGASVSVGSAITSRVFPTGTSTTPVTPVPPVPQDVLYEINGDSSTLGTVYSVNGTPL